MKTNREEILQHALRLFMSMNYESVSLQMIAHSVGLTKTGIFNYYPSKLDLFIAVADHYLFHLQDPETSSPRRTGRCATLSTNTSRVSSAPWQRSCGWATSAARRCPDSWPTPVTFTSSNRYSSTIPTASANSTNGWKRSSGSGARLSAGVSSRANCVPIQTSRKPPHSSGRFSSDYHTRCLLTKDSTSEFFTSVSFIYMSC